MDWTACFRSGMPGVWLVSITPTFGAVYTAYVQWTEDLEIGGGLYQTEQIAVRIKGLSSAIGGLVRGDRVTHNGNTWLVTTDAHTDADGVAEVRLEAI